MAILDDPSRCSICHVVLTDEYYDTPTILEVGHQDLCGKCYKSYGIDLRCKDFADRYVWSKKYHRWVMCNDVS